MTKPKPKTVKVEKRKTDPTFDQLVEAIEAYNADVNHNEVDKAKLFARIDMLAETNSAATGLSERVR